MRAPNLFLVGAPKSGTSALYTRLGAHPDVHAPSTKEPNHLGNDLQYRHRRSAAQYEEAFAEWADERYAIDGTVFLLLSSTAAEEIRDLSPRARVLALLRDPIDAIVSLHNQLVHSGDEDQRDLAAALALAPTRRSGEAVPANAAHPHALQYLDVFDYEPQLHTYFDVLGRDRVHVELFDDVRDRPAEVLRRVLAFLELPEVGTGAIEKVNPARGLRSGAVRDLVYRPPTLIRRVGRAVARTPKARQRLRHAARTLEVRYNRPPTATEPIDPALRAELVAHWRPRVDALAELIDRDLSAWLQR